MGSLIKEKGHELLAFDYSNVVSDIFGDVSLASRNLNPDPLFDTVRPDGRMKYFKLGHAPRPDGWGVFVKGPAASSAFSEQNGYPLPLGEEPYYDLDHPLINGAPLPEKRDYVDIAQPDAPRSVIFVTGDKAYPTGWYCAAHAYRMSNPARTTTPDPDTAGFLGSRTEPFQMSGSVGSAFYLPVPPKDAKEIVLYLTNVQTTSAAAINAPLFEQFSIPIEDNTSNVVEFKGPLKISTPAPKGNKTKLSEWGGAGGFNVDRDKYGGNNDAYDVQFAYDLIDSSGKSIGVTSKLYHMGANSGRNYRFHPKIDSLNKVVKDSIKGWIPYVRYRDGSDWGKWKSIRKKGGDNVFDVSTWVQVFGPKWTKHSKYDLVSGQPSKKDTSGIPNPTEAMTPVDAVVSLNSSGLINGKHRIKVVLYDGDQPSEPSPASVVDIGASNQVPRIYQPFFTNRLDNPQLIDTAGTTSRPRDWVFNRDARTTYEKGKLTVNEQDGQATRGDLIVTPYGYIGLNELRYSGRVIVEVAKHVTGKAVDVLMEYHVDSYSSTGVPNVTFIKQSTLGVHRRNGKYSLGFKTDATRARDAIPLGPTTNLVVIKTIGDGSDPNLGVRNYLTVRRGHGIFTTLAPHNLKTGDYVDKVDWFEPDDQSAPHGGYCKVVTNGEDHTIHGVAMNQADTGITVPSGPTHTVSTSAKTIEARFRTGEDITTAQTVYREGNGVQGYSLTVESGNLHFRVWNASTVAVNLTTPVFKHQKFVASLVRTATGVTAYLDGVQVGTSATAVSAFASSGASSIGQNNGTMRSSTSVSVTALQPLLGRVYEIRVWNVAKSAAFIAANQGNTLSAADYADASLYLPMDEMEGSTVYDKTSSPTNGTVVGTYRWVSGEADGAWTDASSTIDRLNFADGTIPGTWTAAGTATNTVGDFSASRFSEYGMRVTGTGTNVRNLTRTGIGTLSPTAFAGIQKRFITLPVGGSVTFLQLIDGTGVVGEAQVTASGQLQFRGPGAGAWTTFLNGVEPGERMYVELKAEGLGTASGTLRVFVGQTHDTELAQVGMLTGLTFTTRNVTSVKAGPSATTGTITNNWDFHVGEVMVGTAGKARKEYTPGNYIEYFGPAGTPVNESYGMTGLSIPCVPGTVMTHSVHAKCEGLVKGEDQILGITFYNEDDEEISQKAYLVDFNDIESEWRRYSKTFTVPPNAAYFTYDRNNIGQGMYRIQSLQIEVGSLTQFTARRNASGYVRVKFDSITPGCAPGKPMDVLGKAVSLYGMSTKDEIEDNEDITLQIASSATANGTYSAYFTDVNSVPVNRWYEVKATLTTTDLTNTPVLKAILLDVQRPYPMLLKPNGSEYKGGTLINNMSPPTGRRLVEVTQMDDGSGGFTTWGSEKPMSWIEPFEFNVFRESVMDQITSNIGRGDSTFEVEYNGMIYTIRVVEPIEFETRRASHIALSDETEDFYRFIATMPRSEVVDAREI